MSSSPASSRPRRPRRRPPPAAPPAARPVRGCARRGRCGRVRREQNARRLPVRRECRVACPRRRSCRRAGGRCGAGADGGHEADSRRVPAAAPPLAAGAQPVLGAAGRARGSARSDDDRVPAAGDGRRRCQRPRGRRRSRSPRRRPRAGPTGPRHRGSRSVQGGARGCRGQTLSTAAAQPTGPSRSRVRRVVVGLLVLARRGRWWSPCCCPDLRRQLEQAAGASQQHAGEQRPGRDDATSAKHRASLPRSTRHRSRSRC